MPQDFIPPDKLENNFTDLCKRFRELLQNEQSTVKPVWAFEVPPSPLPFLPESFLQEGVEALRKKIEAARHYLPLAYRKTYVEPLLHNLDRTVRCHDDPVEMHNIVEALAGAVTQHLPASQAEEDVRHPLRQFLAVVSNLYRSFLAPDKRAAAHVPLAVPTLPPLATFHHQVKFPHPFGPAVFTSSMIRLLCGAEVAVTVLPANLARFPLTWVALAHEACGHGVLQADPNLLPDLAAGVRALFGGGPLPPDQEPDKDQALGLLWSYWVEETASDVYGLLNVGPAFALNLAAFIAARLSRVFQSRNPPEDAPFPLLAVQSGTDPRVDLGVHPTDLLRLHVAIGVIENLTDLSRPVAREYIRLISKVSRLLEKNARQFPAEDDRGKIVIRGRVEVERERWVSLDRKLPFKEAAESARRVGAYIASARLGALGNRTIQDVETWDDADELVARSICTALLRDPQVRTEEAGKEKWLDIDKALKEFDFGKQEIDAVIKALIEDRFQDISENALQALRLSELTGELIGALRAERIETLMSDPGAAQLIRGLDLNRVDALGDDGQLLAGATLAALKAPAPESFRWINRRLAFALFRSYQHDPIVGSARAHGMFDQEIQFGQPVGFVTLPPAEAEQDHLEQASGPPSSRNRKASTGKKRATP